MILIKTKEFGLTAVTEKRQKSLKRVVVPSGPENCVLFSVTLDTMKVFKDVVLPKAQVFFAKSFSGKVVTAVFVVGFVLGVVLF